MKSLVEAVLARRARSEKAKQRYAAKKEANVNTRVRWYKPGVWNAPPEKLCKHCLRQWPYELHKLDCEKLWR